MVCRKKQALSLDISYCENGIGYCVVTIPTTIVDTTYEFIINREAEVANPHGFHQRHPVTAQYIRRNCESSLIEHLSEFLFNYVIQSFLYQALREHKVTLTESPSIVDIILKPHQDAEYHCAFTTTHPIPLRDWKYIPFKPPIRKKYKDLDKRAKDFIQEEEKNFKEYESKNLVDIGDWICFDVCPTLSINTQKPILSETYETLWLKIGEDEESLPFQEVFLKRRCGDSFYTNNRCIQEYFSSYVDTNYPFYICITDFLSNKYFSLEYFKKHFKLKTNKSAHQKLIEVFSCNNDLPLRHSIIESIFDQLLLYHDITLSDGSIERQIKQILDILKENPDYQVYRKESDFTSKVHMLAERQLKEIGLIDYLSFRENLEVTHCDVKHYLHMSQRLRTKDFIYFQHPAIKANEQEYPISAQTLKQLCLREKTLNHVIHQLTEP